MRDAPFQKSAGDRLVSLQMLSNSDGWAIYCARLEEKMRKELDEVALNVKTPSERTEVLKAARAYLTEGFAPHKVLESLLAVTKSELAAEEKEADRRIAIAGTINS